MIVMQKVKEDLFYGENKCHQRFEADEDFRAASLQADESIRRLEADLKGEDLEAVRALEDAHAQMNASTAIECYVEGFFNAARLFIAMLYEEPKE